MMHEIPEAQFLDNKATIGLISEIHIDSWMVSLQ